MGLKIALVGSSKLKEEIINYAKELELAGNIALCSHIFSHADNYELTSVEFHNAVKNGHERIDMANIVICVMKKYYIGESTREEILYAYRRDKQVFYYLYEDKMLMLNLYMADLIKLDKHTSIMIPSHMTSKDYSNMEPDEVFNFPDNLIKATDLILNLPLCGVQF